MCVQLVPGSQNECMAYLQTPARRVIQSLVYRITVYFPLYFDFNEEACHDGICSLPTMDGLIEEQQRRQRSFISKYVYRSSSQPGF